MNALDIAVIGVLLVSGLFALMRGFVHEVLSVTAWIGAAAAALYGLPLARPIAQQHIEKAWMADVAAGAALFLVTLVVLSLITHFIAKRVRDSALNSLDRSLGFVFGVARGAVLVVLAYILADWLLEPGQEPQWMLQAKTRPMMAQGAEVLQRALPAEFSRLEADAKGAAAAAGNAEKLYQGLANPKARSEPEARPQAPVYDERQRQDLNRAFQSNQ